VLTSKDGFKILLKMIENMKISKFGIFRTVKLSNSTKKREKHASLGLNSEEKPAIRLTCLK
jgi:hypothetical protein